MKHRTSMWIPLFALALPLRAADPPKHGAAAPSHATTTRTHDISAGVTSVTHHKMKVVGGSLEYTATAGTLPLKDETGKPRADIFYVAYSVQADADLSRRPIAFAFNGGPGASSMWLHIGGIGPKRVLLAANGTALPESDKLADNEYTWLAFTDLVFVDPVGTGYSRAAPGVDARQFYDVAKDIDVAGDFIRVYVTEHERWLSPKFVIGESYGTTRAAGLVGHLQHAQGMDLAGVVLISSALNFQAFMPREGNDLPYALLVPSFTAAAWYHKKLPPAATGDLEQVVSRAQHWALTEYTAAQARGDTLPKAERQRVIEQMSRLTGLPEDYIAQSRMRVSASRFAKELLRSENRTLGNLDARVAGVGLSPRGEYAEYDPAMFLVTGPLVAAINDYLRRDLKYHTTMPYEFLSREVNRSWKYLPGGHGYLYVGDDLAEAMSKDTRLRVFAAAGYYDLTTPYLSQKYTFDHLGLDPSIRGHLTFKAYPSGHQIYTDPASLKALRGDVAAFFREPRRRAMVADETD